MFYNHWLRIRNVTFCFFSESSIVAPIFVFSKFEAMVTDFNSSSLVFSNAFLLMFREFSISSWPKSNTFITNDQNFKLFESFVIKYNVRSIFYVAKHNVWINLQIVLSRIYRTTSNFLDIEIISNEAMKWENNVIMPSCMCYIIQHTVKSV